MTGANKQAQWFGPTLSSVLARSETAGERELSVMMVLDRGAQFFTDAMYMLWVLL